MTKATFTNEERALLADMKGKIFVSYECEKDPPFSRAYGNVRINTDAYSAEIRNETEPFPFFGETEDMSRFSCTKVNPSVPFRPAVVKDSQIVPVNEKIISAELITDTIDVNNGEYVFVFDAALILRTEKRTFMFARDIWFSENITIAENDDYDSIFPLETAKESLSNYGEYPVKATRNKAEA